MIEAADLDKDGLVSADDFYVLMTNKTNKHIDSMHWAWFYYKSESLYPSSCSKIK